MKKSIGFLVKYFVLSLAFISYAQADESDEVRSIIEGMAVLIESGDLDALGTIYAPGPGVHIIEGSGVNHGWEDYRDNHLRPELASYSNLSFRYFAIEPIVRDEVAFAAFRYELKAETQSGPLNVAGRGTLVLEKMLGSWKIVHSHTSGRRNE